MAKNFGLVLKTFLAIVVPAHSHRGYEYYSYNFHSKQLCRYFCQRTVYKKRPFGKLYCMVEACIMSAISQQCRSLVWGSHSSQLLLSTRKCIEISASFVLMICVSPHIATHWQCYSHMREEGFQNVIQQQILLYRVSHIIGPTLFLLFSRLLEHIQRNFS